MLNSIDRSTDAIAETVRVAFPDALISENVGQIRIITRQINTGQHLVITSLVERLSGSVNIRGLVLGVSITINW